MLEGLRLNKLKKEKSKKSQYIAKMEMRKKRTAFGKGLLYLRDSLSVSDYCCAGQKLPNPHHVPLLAQLGESSVQRRGSLDLRI